MSVASRRRAKANVPPPIVKPPVYVPEFVWWDANKDRVPPNLEPDTRRLQLLADPGIDVEDFYQGGVERLPDLWGGLLGKSGNWRAPDSMRLWKAFVAMGWNNVQRAVYAERTGEPVKNRPQSPAIHDWRFEQGLVDQAMDTGIALDKIMAWPTLVEIRETVAGPMLTGELRTVQWLSDWIKAQQMPWLRQWEEANTGRIGFPLGPVSPMLWLDNLARNRPGNAKPAAYYLR